MSTDTLYQQLRDHLHYLKLPAVAEQLAPALERAERDRPGYTVVAGRLDKRGACRPHGDSSVMTEPLSTSGIGGTSSSACGRELSSGHAPHRRAR